MKKQWKKFSSSADRRRMDGSPVRFREWVVLMTTCRYNNKSILDNDIRSLSHSCFLVEMTLLVRPRRNSRRKTFDVVQTPKTLKENQSFYSSSDYVGSNWMKFIISNANLINCRRLLTSHFRHKKTIKLVTDVKISYWITTSRNYFIRNLKIYNWLEKYFKKASSRELRYRMTTLICNEISFL